MKAPAGTFIAYSTVPGNVADDGNGVNSIYAGDLIRAVKTPNLPLESVFKEVLSAVKRKTNGRQIPWIESSIEGEFYFVYESLDTLNFKPRWPNKGAVENKSEAYYDAKSFLAQNKKKPGVVTAPDGLQYKVIKVGTGLKPKTIDTVTINFRLTLIDGREVYNTYKHGAPATFPIKDVVDGWSEALTMMPIGSKWEVYIPPDLGFGEAGVPRIIPSNSFLIYEVELLSFNN